MAIRPRRIDLHNLTKISLAFLSITRMHEHIKKVYEIPKEFKAKAMDAFPNHELEALLNPVREDDQSIPPDRCVLPWSAYLEAKENMKANKGPGSDGLVNEIITKIQDREVDEHIYRVLNMTLLGWDDAERAWEEAPA